jgi:hypothetical protein
MDNWTKNKIQQTAYGRMSVIEERYVEHVPDHIQSYWRLNYMIAEGVRAYVGSFGLLSIHLGDAQDGRLEVGLGPLSGFERDVIYFLNTHIAAEENCTSLGGTNLRPIGVVRP